MPGKLVVCKRCGDSFAEGVGIRCSCKEELKQAVKNLKRANSHLARINSHLKMLLKDGEAFAYHTSKCGFTHPPYDLKCTCGFSQWRDNFKATMEEIT